MYNLFARSPTNEAVELAIKEISLFPKNLINIIKESGLKIYLLDKDTKASYIGLINHNINTVYGRTYDDTDMAWFTWTKNIIVFYSEIFYEDEDGFKSMIHEFAHAIDWNLGNNKFLTSSKEFQKIKQKGNPLDWYAATNPREYFAQGIEAYFRSERELCESYRVHNKIELAKKDYGLYEYIRSLIGNET